MPEDVKQVCLWLARGYERRKLAALGGAMLSVRERERMEAVEQALVAVGSDIPSGRPRQTHFLARNAGAYPRELWKIPRRLGF